jgi:hypothetical protein
MADKLAVRCLEGQWQVLLDSPEKWQDCHDEHDARAIAKGQVLARDVVAGVASGDEVAKELEDAARAIRRNIGNCTAERYFDRAARVARGEEEV